MTWIARVKKPPGSRGHTEFEQTVNGVIAETLSLQEFIDHVNELEEACVIVAMEPKLINVLHTALKKAI